MLRACREVLKPGGRMAFYTIFAPAGLSEESYDRARGIGPFNSVSPRDHPQMLKEAGFVDIRAADATPQYMETLRSWIAARTRHAKALRSAIGNGELTQLLAEHTRAVVAVEAGLRRRALFTARRAP